MNRLKNYCVNEDQTIKDAISVIQNNLSRCVMVLNAQGKVVGTFSEGDVLRSLLQDVDVHIPLKKVINPSFHYLNENDMLKAYELVKRHGITLVPVVDDEFELKDVITIFQIMEHLVFTNRKVR